jgi:hypothetical protein
LWCGVDPTVRNAMRWASGAQDGPGELVCLLKLLGVNVLGLGLVDMDAFEVGRIIRANSARCHPALLLIHPVDPPEITLFRGMALSPEFYSITHDYLDFFTRGLERIFENGEQHGHRSTP